MVWMMDGIPRTGGIDAAITRRRFVRNAGAAAAGATLLGTYGSGSAGGAATPTPADRRRLRWWHRRPDGGARARRARVQGDGLRAPRVGRQGPQHRGPSVAPRGGRTAAARRALPAALLRASTRTSTDTLRRIPFGSNPNGVFDNLVAALPRSWRPADGQRQRGASVRRDRRPPLHTPSRSSTRCTARSFKAGFPPQAASPATSLPASPSSSPAARLVVVGQWERTPWTEFVRRRSLRRRLTGDAGQHVFSEFVPGVQGPSGPAHTSRPASSRDRSSTACSGSAPNGRELPNPQPARPTRRGSTRGCSLLRRMRRAAAQLVTTLTRLRGRQRPDRRRAHPRTAGCQERSRPTGTYARFRSSVPAASWSQPILAADPLPGRIWTPQHRLDERHEVLPSPRSARSYAATSCAPTRPGRSASISQAQFWPVDFAKPTATAQVRESLSVFISNWNEPGVLYGKPARECIRGGDRRRGLGTDEAPFQRRRQDPY